MTKKTRRMDIERHRWEMFLMGFLFVAATFFVLIEYNVPAVDADDAELLEELAQDLELLPALEQERMLAEVPVPEETVIAPVIKVVDEPVDELAVLDELVEAGTQEQEADDEPLPQVEMTVTTTDDEPIDASLVDQLPEFPGGMLYFMKWLTRNIVYPTAARDAKVQGRMAVSFIVNADGTTSNIELMDSFDDRMDREVMRVLQRMPRWQPGLDQGKPCRTMMVVPLVFQL